jgi:hypothetical protein
MGVSCAVVRALRSHLLAGNGKIVAPSDERKEAEE